MNFYQKIGSESYFIDSITHNSFIMFIVLREYIGCLLISNSSVDRTHCINSKERIDLYMLMYEMLKENIGNPFDILKDDHNRSHLPAYLRPIIQGRIERLRNYYEAVAYTNLSTFKNLIFLKFGDIGNDADEDNDDDDDNENEISDMGDNNSRKKFLLAKDSVFGLFLRKFALGFYSQSFEKMIQFLDSFYEAYDNQITNNVNRINMKAGNEHKRMDSSSTSSTWPENDSIVHNFAHSFKRDQYLISTRNQALEVCSGIIDSVGKFGGRPNINLQRYNELLSLAKKMYPELSYTHYASHIYALHIRNFTMAENELHSYFETCMARIDNPEASLIPAPSKSSSATAAASAAGVSTAAAAASTTTATTTAGAMTSSASNPTISSSNTCAHMAVTAAAMHLNFGHWHRGKCLIKEALQKSLESESKDSLGHVKVTHTLLNSSADPFRYDDQVPMKKPFKSNNVTLTEFRTKFWSALDSGSEPYELLTAYFNSSNAISQAYFAICQLDLATMWQFYGYPNMATVLMQCIINADCLHPCPNSDTVLTNAFANIIKEFSSMGLIETALKLSKICRSTLCRFPGQSPLLQASIEIELEQNLRSGYDLAQCDRLVNSLRLYCPWEAALRQAEVEQKRGNISYTHDILRYIIDSIIERRDHDCGLLKQSSKNNDNEKLLHSSNDLWNPKKPFTHLILPTFPEHTPVGGLCKLANIELRAHLALIELLITLKLYMYAFSEIDVASKLCRQYKLNLGLEMINLLQCAAHLSMNNNQMKTATTTNNNDSNTGHNNSKQLSFTWINKLREDNPTGMLELNTSLEEILHRTDQLTKIRCRVFISRIRLLNDTNENDRSFIQMHIAELLKALHYYRQLDDRKRVLDILVLMATALNSMNEPAKRNEVSKSFHMLREHFGFDSTPVNRFVVDIL